MLQFNITPLGMQNALDQLGLIPVAVDDGGKKALEKVAPLIVQRAKEYCPVDTGKLRDSIDWDERYNGIEIFAGMYYACVANCTVKMSTGFKRLSQIKVGDEVITQDGYSHKVLNVNSFPMTEKPDMIHFEIEYRSDKNRGLDVTKDHKILTIKKGVSYWAEAQSLQEGDVVFVPRKLSHNKGHRTVRVCKNCGKEFISQFSRRNCSLKCANESRLKAHLGSKRSEESKEKMRIARKKFHKEHPEKHVNRILAQKGYRTSTEREVESFLQDLNVEYFPQCKVGNHFVDFAVPELSTVFEADGAFWHKDQQKDINRDEEILELLPGWQIVHLHFTDRHTPKDLQLNPIENSYYLQCNNSMHSFINLKFFKPARILKKKAYTYVQKSSTPKMLYDLTVEGVHSFVAGGVVVSNCFVEYGTSKMAAQPYLRPAMAEFIDSGYADKKVADGIQEEMRKGVVAETATTALGLTMSEMMGGLFGIMAAGLTSFSMAWGAMQ